MQFSNCSTEERSEGEFFCAVWKRNGIEMYDDIVFYKWTKHNFLWFNCFRTYSHTFSGGWCTTCTMGNNWNYVLIYVRSWSLLKCHISKWTVKTIIPKYRLLRSLQPFFTKLEKSHTSAHFFVRVFVSEWYKYFETTQVLFSLCFREKGLKTLIYEWHLWGTF